VPPSALQRDIAIIAYFIKFVKSYIGIWAIFFAKYVLEKIVGWIKRKYGLAG